jgi:hypothetical protein
MSDILSLWDTLPENIQDYIQEIAFVTEFSMFAKISDNFEIDKLNEQIIKKILDTEFSLFIHIFNNFEMDHLHEQIIYSYF